MNSNSKSKSGTLESRNVISPSTLLDGDVISLEVQDVPLQTESEANNHGLVCVPTRSSISSPPKMAMAGLYRRVLSSPPAIDFGSSQGKQLFREAIQNRNMEGFPRLVSCFQTQSELGFCGLASLSMVLNALGIDPGRKWKGPWRWFDEYMLDYGKPLDKIKTEGISFENLVSLAHCSGAKVEAFHASDSNMDDFRKYVMKCSTSDECHVITSFHRKALKQTGAGHHSPIGGYHAGKDMALVLDVARFKYPPFWVPLTHLWEGMSYTNDFTGKSRGFMLISKPPMESEI